MAENETTEERNEEPTERRLKKAREEGTVARSKELSTALVTMSGLAWLAVASPWILDALSTLFKVSFQWRDSLDQQDVGPLINAAMTPFIWLFSSFFIVVVIASMIAGSSTGGWVASSKILRPKAERLSIIKGFKRVFSVNSLMELVKAILKVILVAVVAFLTVNVFWDSFQAAQRASWPGSFVQGMTLVLTCVIIIASVSLLIAAIDVPFQIQQYLKQVKMSRKEVKDEMKETDGNPELKSKRRSMQYELAQNRAISSVPDADVVITNPTHFAVALKYNPQQQAAPIALGMGLDLVALKMISIAKERNVVVFEAPMLARALYYTSKVDQPIAEPLFLAVAQVLAYVMQLRSYRTTRQDPPTRPSKLKVPVSHQYTVDGAPVKKTGRDVA